MGFILIASLTFCAMMEISFCTMQGFVEDVMEKRRYTCPQALKLSYTAASQIQCVSKCSIEKLCTFINFIAKDKVPKDNCEVFQKPVLEPPCPTVITTELWLAMRFKRVEQQELKIEENQVSVSCKEIFDSGKDYPDGVYSLASGKHFCIMSSLGECGGGGWTLAMTVNGSKNTFESDSSYWQDDNVYEIDEGLRAPYQNEAKYPAFSAIGFQSVCIGMTYDNGTRWIHINKSASSLLDVFGSNQYSKTEFGVAKWTSFISGGCLQPDCNREGFNAGRSGAIYVRIGIASNKKWLLSECSRIQSYIGIGTKVSDTSFGCLQNHRGVSCGNFAMCDACGRSVAAIGTIFVK